MAQRLTLPMASECAPRNPKILSPISQLGFLLQLFTQSSIFAPPQAWGADMCGSLQRILGAWGADLCGNLQRILGPGVLNCGNLQRILGPGVK